MAQIASEALVERLIDWGVDTVFGLPGDGINGIMEGLRRHQDKIKFVLVHHEEAAAFMAVAHAKATGQDRRLPGDLRPRRHPPAERPVRREARPRAGARHHRDAGDLAARHRLPAGGRARQAVRRRRRVRHDDLQPGADPGGDRPRDPHRLRAARRRAHHHPQRHPGRRRGRRPVAARGPGQHAEDRRDLPRRRRGCPSAEDLQRLADFLNEGNEDRHPGRRGRAARPRGAPRGRRGARRADRQDAARQGRRSRRLPVHHRRDRAARHQAVRGPDGRDRHAADGRHQLPVHQAPAGKACGARRSRPTRPGPAPASPPRCRSSATRSRPCAPCCRCSSSGRSTSSSPSTSGR